MTLKDLKRHEANKQLYKYLDIICYLHCDSLKRCDPKRVKNSIKERNNLLDELCEFYYNNYND